MPAATNLPLLMIPGLACTGKLFAAQIAELGKNRPVIIADHTGHDNFHDLAASILEQAPQRFALAGLSMGGYLSFELLRQAPERIDRLALLDTSARNDTSQKISERQQAIKLAESGKFEMVSRSTLPLMLSASSFKDEQLKDQIIAMAMDTGVPMWKLQMTALMHRPSSLDMLSDIDIPTMVVVGSEDQLTPLDCAREMADSIPCSTLHVIDDCGHMSTMEKPQQLNQLLQDWLEQ